MKRTYNKSEPDLHRCVELVRKIYASPYGGAGCCLHVLTDDGNYDSADWVLNNAEPSHHDCIEAAKLLVSFSPTRRAKVCKLAHYG